MGGNADCDMQVLMHEQLSRMKKAILTLNGWKFVIENGDFKNKCNQSLIFNIFICKKSNICIMYLILPGKIKGIIVKHGVSYMISQQSSLNAVETLITCMSLIIPKKT